MTIKFVLVEIVLVETVLVGDPLYVLFYLSNHMILFFQLFHISGDGNRSSAMELKLKVSHGRKCFRCGKYLMVKKVAVKSVSGWKLLGPKNINVQKISLGGKHLTVGNVWPSKKLQPLSES